MRTRERQMIESSTMTGLVECVCLCVVVGPYAAICMSVFHVSISNLKSQQGLSLFRSVHLFSSLFFTSPHIFVLSNIISCVP